MKNCKYLWNNWRVRIRVRMFSATFNNISTISWRSVLLVKGPGVHGENHRSAASHWLWYLILCCCFLSGYFYYTGSMSKCSLRLSWTFSWLNIIIRKKVNIFCCSRGPSWSWSYGSLDLQLPTQSVYITTEVVSWKNTNWSENLIEIN
jgi:hypothetical protein